MFDLTQFDITEVADRDRLISHLSEIICRLTALSQSPVSDPEGRGAVYGDSGTFWPRLAEPEADSHVPIFASAAYRERYRPGKTVRVYALGSTGLRKLAGRLDIPLRKVGVSEQEDVRLRCREVNADRYGCCYLAPDGFVDEAGYDDYVAAQIELRKEISPLSPVRHQTRVLSVTLPATLSFLKFERLLQEGGRSVSLADWAQSQAGLQHLARIGAPPDIAKRQTAYRYGEEVARQTAEEIWVFRPRKDGDRLVGLIERIILRHLGL